MGTGRWVPVRRSPRAFHWTGATALLLALLMSSCGWRLSTPRASRAETPAVAATPPSASPIRNTMAAAYGAGFHTEAQLLAATSIAIAESSLGPNTRHWHPEYGFRPPGDVLGVTGGADVRSADGRQLHSDRGIWQISSHFWPQFTDAQCDDPVSAAQLAFAISTRGTDFSPWDVYGEGAAQAHYDRALDGWPPIRPVVRDFLTSLPR